MFGIIDPMLIVYFPGVLSDYQSGVRCADDLDWRAVNQIQEAQSLMGPVMLLLWCRT
jgi:hypothetical protein